MVGDPYEITYSRPEAEDAIGDCLECLGGVDLKMSLGDYFHRQKTRMDDEGRGAHTSIGQTYFWTVSAVSITGGALAIVDWDRNAPFLAIAVLTQSLALLG